MSLHYVGSGPYCYADSMAMALAAAGAVYDPGYLECLTAVGVGACWEPAPDGPLPFFSGGGLAPDAGIDAALGALGWGFEAGRGPAEADPDGSASLARLCAFLRDGPVIVGPLDMGLLLYQPGHEHLAGADHYGVVYAATDDEVFLHDPAGYPYASLPVGDFVRAWRAETVGYRLGSFSMWGCFRRERHPTPDEVFAATDGLIAECLRRETGGARRETGDDEASEQGPAAMRRLAGLVRDQGVPGSLFPHLGSFLFPVSARRCSDYARFYGPYDAERASIKAAQGRAIGAANAAMMRKEWERMAAALDEVADQEARFQERTLAESAC